MEKEYQWSATVDGETHTILCQVMNNKYVLWVDDKFLKNIYRKAFQRTRGGIDETLELWGKTCHFVVGPDEWVGFFVDDQSLEEQDAGASYKQRMGQYKRVMLICSAAVVAITGVACMSYLALAFLGKDVSGWSGTFLAALIVLVLGIVSVFTWRKRE